MENFYSAQFAAVYDRYFASDLKNIAESIRRYAEGALGTTEKRMLDLCCGTGQLLEHFTENGYSTIGIDGSEAMLEVAGRRNTASVTAGAVSLLHSDATDFSIGEQVSLVTSTGDSLNHLTQLEELRRCFAAVRRALKPGGLFVFDMHSLAGLQMQNFATIRDLPDLLLTVRLTYDPASSRTVARVAGFSRSDDGAPWERFEQNATNTAWPAEQICATLAATGFEKSWPARLGDLAAAVDDPDQMPRIFFVAQG